MYFLDNPLYSKAYYQDLKNGEVKNTRIPIMIVGNDRTGKTSLKKHLLGLDFNTKEPSTNGIEVDMVELTAEDAKDPWKIKDKNFFTSAEEAEEEILKSTAQYVMKKKKTRS